MVENRMKDRKLFLGVNVDCNPVHIFPVNVLAIGLYKRVTRAEAKGTISTIAFSASLGVTFYFV
jgi:uncharacterized membrane protein YiaA